jgi:hypothetical protein
LPSAAPLLFKQARQVFSEGFLGGARSKGEAVMIYRKNVFNWEQGVRIALGVGLAGYPFFAAAEPAWPWIAGGAMLALTGLFGFCPACYAVGRKTPNFQQPQHG